MPSVSYDGQSFLIDGRRIWLVSGSIHYPRVPRELWRNRIRAAKQAGLNCIDTYVFWNVHESKPDTFDFQGQNDLRHFVQLIAQEGMFCILRPGPYVCSEWDFGGLPVWLHRVADIKLRQANPAFLEACARYYGAVMEQVRDLQVTSPVPPGMASTAAGGGGGPIILVQVENEWFCHHKDQATAYLAELARYLRENGCEVPLNNCNNLWQRVDGTIDTWNGNEHLATNLRQLRVVQPHAPRLVTEFWPGWFDQWDGPHHTANDPDTVSHRLAQILASGAQYNLYMFHGGTNFGFRGGRTIARPDCFITTSYDFDAPLTEAGGRGAKYLAVKRISTFASQFAQIFAHLESDQHHAAPCLDDEKNHPLAVIQQTGPQGTVVFIIKNLQDETAHADLMLPNGRKLTVPLDTDRVAWTLLHANLGGAGELTYTNLRPWAFLARKMLVLFGPAGAAGVVCVNDAVLHVQIPIGREPHIAQHEKLTIVVLNQEQVDAAYMTAQNLILGAAAIDEKDQPVPLPGWPTILTIAPDGQVTRQISKPTRIPAAPRLTDWQRAGVSDMLAGTAPQFTALPGPASLEMLNCDYGYGWYRLTFKDTQTGPMLAPQAGDRLHFFHKTKPIGLLGLGPGAEFSPSSLRLHGDIVVLADNLGRCNYGWHVGERKGLDGHIHAVKPVRLGKPKIVSSPSPDIFGLSQFWLGLRWGEHHPADALVWSIPAPGKGLPLILDLSDLPVRVLVLLNGQPVQPYDPSASARYLRLLLEPKPGRNEIKIALFEKLRDAKQLQQIVARLRLYQSQHNVTAKAQWAFMPWTTPPANAFKKPGRSVPGQPAWHRAQFRVTATAVPLWLEPRGLTKGQIYLNGHNIGRYFVATAKGRPVVPQARYYLPEPWLKTEGMNELVIFEEHGKSPTSCRLMYDALGPYGK